MRHYYLFILFLSFTSVCLAQKVKVKLIKVDSGWANNSVNTAIFRKNSLVSFHNWQFIAYYNKDGFVVLGKRKLNDTKWVLKQTQFKGNVSDAHNVISIMIDGDGYLHMAWNHHNNSLHYVKSKAPGSLEMTKELSMAGKLENKVSYPEFYRMPNGNLIFFYRDGGSGNGSLVVNQYDIKTRTWKQLHSNLIDGEGQRSAYWQACVDTKGYIHLSWVWRETPDVATNHDLCYTCSKDGGLTWQKSSGEIYKLPITASNAEYAFHIPQKSELINQTSMFADDDGRPYIATYWREDGSAVPQYHLVYKTNDSWEKEVLDFRKTPFSLSGGGTKKIPISRPQAVAWKEGKNLSAALIFRDAERGDKVSVAINKNIGSEKWNVIDLTQTAVGSWEPTYDTELWKEKKVLHVFVENVEQVDAEGQAKIPAQMIEVVEWDPKKTIGQ
jgi:hypothetical protein